MREAESILSFSLHHCEVDLVEIQNQDIHEVVSAKLAQAYEKLDLPVIVEDTGLFLDGYGGFPGTMVKWILKSSGSSGIVQMADGCNSREAEAVCCVGAFDGKEITIVTGRMRGRIAETVRGENNFGWDNIFIPENSILTYAEMTPDEKRRDSHRTRAWKALTDAIDTQK